jgi:drug/metabolite transporter (DMT)-like permease
MFTIFLGITLLGDRLSFRDLLGSGVVLSGLYLLSASRDLGKAAPPPVGIIAQPREMTRPLAVDRGVLYGILSGLSLSVGHIFRKLGLLHISSPVIGVAAGTLVSLLCFTTYMLLKTKNPSGLLATARETACLRKSCRGYIWGGFFNTFAQYLFFLSLLYTSIPIANILISTEALFNLLLAALFFRLDEPISRRLVLLSLFVVAGVVMIIL